MIDFGVAWSNTLLPVLKYPSNEFCQYYATGVQSDKRKDRPLYELRKGLQGSKDTPI